MSSAPDAATKIFVDGEWRSPTDPQPSIDLVDPSTEAVFATVCAGGAGDVDQAVAAARRGLQVWSSASPAQRAGVLASVRDALEERRGEMAELITRSMGCPPRIADAVQVGAPLAVLASYVELLPAFTWEERLGSSLVVREPAGVVGAITPWNYPLHQVVAKVAGALAAGCAVVLKPSEVAPLPACALAHLFAEAGLPAGVLNVVNGTGPVVGEAIAAHPDIDMVSFTGSTRAGVRVAQVAAGTVKRVALELGGKSANVLLPDADISRAVKAGVNNAFLNSGQTCTALSRLLVPRDRHEEVAAMAGAAADAMTARLGPLASRAQFDRVQGYIDRGLAEGARLVTGGPGRAEGRDIGFFARPTVFADVTSEMTIAREEIFGPVLSVMPYDDEDDALRIAESTPYGLAGAVWSADTERAIRFARRMRTGQVDINGASFNPLAPFGGFKQSGIGRELGPFGLSEFCEIKSIQV